MYGKFIKCFFYSIALLIGVIVCFVEFLGCHKKENGIFQNRWVMDIMEV